MHIENKKAHQLGWSSHFLGLSGTTLYRCKVQYALEPSGSSSLSGKESLEDAGHVGDIGQIKPFNFIYEILM